MSSQAAPYLLALIVLAGCSSPVGSFAISQRPVETVSPSPVGMVEVPEGGFVMGTDDGAYNAQPAHKVFLDRYYIDRTEVTVADYRACVDDGGCTPPTIASEYCSGDDEASNNWNKHDRDDHPVNCIDWEQAHAFCAWAGKRLPTEAEWEKAARGPDARTFPWGEDDATCERAVMMDDNTGQGCGEETTLPVGSRPEGESVYGALDMSGSVFEWTEDWYEEDYYARSPEQNPRGAEEPTDSRVARGGGLDNDASEMQSTIRTPVYVTFTADNLGVRCALTPGG